MAHDYRIALVAAMEREIAPFVRGWNLSEREHDGRKYQFFENKDVVVVCGGIGSESARRATEAVISLYRPASMQSVGLAGGLDPKLKVGAIFSPRWVVDARDGSRADTAKGDGVLVSAGEIASVAQKARLAHAYGAQAVDMEAASVAQGAEAHGLPFSALKAISDESDFAMPPMNEFISHDGVFRTKSFVLFAAFRPWLWGKMIRLGIDSARAVRALCAELEKEVETETMSRASTLHPVNL
ncbi:MAG TPA: phosphorylase [Terriglobales bacterium]